MKLRIALLLVATSLSLTCIERASAQTQTTDSDARTLFNLGVTAFEEGRYQNALDFFQQAYDLSRRPQLLFNIGQAADRLRLDQRAFDAFVQFLAEVPDSPQHVATRARVELLRASLAAEAAEQAARDDGSNPAPSAPRSPVPGFIALGGGGASLAVGAVFLALGLGDRNSVEDAPLGTSFADVSDAYGRASTRITVGSIMLGVGAAAATTGLVLVLRSGSSEDDETPTAQLQVLPGGLAIRGSF